MASKPLTLQVRPRGKPIKNLPEEISVSAEDTTEQVYHKIAQAANFSKHRLRVTKGSDGSHVAPDSRTTIDELGLKNNSVIYVKDLGLQIAWRTVFLVEYLGPILIHPLIYYLRPYIYRNPSSLPTSSFPPPSTLQTLSLALITLHFLKRELETLLVHRFSAATMPAFNIVKNSAHYWLLAGLNIALFTYSPSPANPTARSANVPLAVLATVLFLVGEAGNLQSHLALRSLRPSGSAERGIPSGGAFELVTCPNYMFETLAWLGIWMANRSWSTGLFVVVAVAQMAAWARKKERRYRREFGERYKAKRYSMIPGVV